MAGFLCKTSPMKTVLILCFVFFGSRAIGQQESAENIFIITTDGFRWQEVFTGADSALINDPDYVQDTSLIKQIYWDQSPEERRKRLMPFFWNVIAKKGQLYGNRNFDNRVDVKNIYKISYPGYNELLTGYADPFPVFNTPTPNKNRTVLEFLNERKEYRDKVIAFSSWYIFPFLLNTKRNGLPVNSGYELMEDRTTDSSVQIAAVQENVRNKTHTRYDLLTYLTAREYIQAHHPKVVYISLGETDDLAHQGRYDLYLEQAANVDRMISELWYYTQTDPFYKNKTTFLITTDYGRGKKPAKWTTHNGLIGGSGQIWLALLGKGIEPLGELREEGRIGQNQVAATIAALLGERFQPNSKTAEPIPLPKPLPNLLTAVSK